MSGVSLTGCGSFLLDQHAPEDLAGRGSGDLCYDLKPADPLVRRNAAGYPRLKLADVDFGPCHDERLGHLAGLGVRARDYGGVQQPGHG